MTERYESVKLTGKPLLSAAPLPRSTSRFEVREFHTTHNFVYPAIGISPRKLRDPLYHYTGLFLKGNTVSEIANLVCSSRYCL